jgi:hypothetical protein
MLGKCGAVEIQASCLYFGMLIVWNQYFCDMFRHTGNVFFFSQTGHFHPTRP